MLKCHSCFVEEAKLCWNEKNCSINYAEIADFTFKRLCFCSVAVNNLILFSVPRNQLTDAQNKNLIKPIDTEMNPQKCSHDILFIYVNYYI